MRTSRCLVTVVAVCLAAALDARQLFAQSAEEKEARSFTESLAATTYGLAWPTATYESWRLNGVERVTGGLDIGVRLSGISAFDNGDLWLELVFQLRNGSLYDIRVLRHNAILAAPFSTTIEVLKLLKSAADDYSRRSAARVAAPVPLPAPAASPRPDPVVPTRSPAEGLCIGNPTATPLKFSYRWGAAEWAPTDVAPARERWFWYPLASGSSSAPAFEIRFDDNLAEGYTNREYKLTSSRAVLPIACADVNRYDFQLNHNAITVVVSPTGRKAPTYSIGVTIVDAGSYVYAGQSYSAGVRIQSLVPASPAAAAGLAVGDIIYKVNGTTAANAQAFVDLVARSGGATLNLDVLRGTSLLRVAVSPIANR